jgi:hypothetical protein
MGIHTSLPSFLETDHEHRIHTPGASSLTHLGGELGAEEAEVEDGHARVVCRQRAQRTSLTVRSGHVEVDEHVV